MTIVRFFRRPTVYDRTLVIVLCLPALISLVTGVLGMTEMLPSAVAYLVSTPFLLMRRNRPLLTTGAVVVVDAVSIATGLVTSSNVHSAVALYSLGRYTGGRPTAIATGAAFAVYAVAMEVDRPGVNSWLSALFLVGVFVGTGQFVRLRTELRERTTREAADAAVRAERRRIARELHDVVAHHITVINALVGGARATLPPEQLVTRDALASAEQTARQAMSEMRRLLDVLRAEGGEGADAATGGRHGPVARPHQGGGVGGPAGHPDRDGRARRAARRRGPRRLPDRPGGADEHPQARRRRQGQRAADL
ncbi:histidine kinase dimerization/phosphoacceptor domain-containing protein [Nonomuraea salmonea]|uniref:histidine kinase dimerization/phosphoacceptor domain-containing protein n=1 Tax=Nonomuraea salmonea TaxID=46181 RepID=UPI002FE97E77